MGWNPEPKPPRWARPMHKTKVAGSFDAKTLEKLHYGNVTTDSV